MPVEIRIQPTPNPSAIKITLSAKVTQGKSETYSSAAQAAANPLAAKLFGIAGVKQVFLLNDFITLTKEMNADWQSIIPAAETAIQEQFA